VLPLPIGPQDMALLSEAGQMTASDCVPKRPELPLASKEESTDALRSCAEIKPVGGKPLDRFWRLGGGRSPAQSDR